MNITVTASVIIAVASLAFTIFREWKHTNAKDTAQETTILIKLENIGATVSEIKTEMQSMKQEWQKDHELIIRMRSDMETVRKDHEDIIKIRAEMVTAWKWIDALKKAAGLEGKQAGGSQASTNT